MLRRLRYPIVAAPALLALVVACSDSVVNTIGVDTVRITPEGATLPVGGSTTLNAAVLGAGGVPLTGRTVAWSSLDAGTASVDGSGRVTGVAPGTARIRAAAEAVADTVVVTVLERPGITLTPATVEFSAAQGGASPGDRAVTIGRSGDGTLDQLAVAVRYGTGQPTGWLEAALTATAAPTTLTLSADHAGLAPGTYTAEVDVTSPAAGNSPATLTARLVVTGPGPAIGLGTHAAAFSALRGGADPASQAVDVTNAGGGSLAGLGVSVAYAQGEPTGWLAASLGRATAPTSLTLRATTGSLAAGTYTATVTVSSSVAGVHPVAVTVTFAVLAPAPTIALGTNSVAFAAMRGGGDPAQQNLTVTNSGGGSLGGLQVAVAYAGGQPAGWLTASLNGTTAPATLALRAAVGSLAAGTYSATVSISSPDAANSPVTLAVTFSVSEPPPAIALSATTRSFETLRGGPTPASQTVQVTNSGGGTLSALQATVTYASGQPTGWLSASLGSTTAPATLSLTAAPGSLPAGTYNATVHVASAVASNSPRTIAVTFTVVEPPPVIALSATTRTFAALRGRADPPPQTVGITNVGGGTLTGLQASVTYAGGQPTGWLDVALDATTAPATLTLTPRTGTLTEGTYQATVQVAAAGASNSPQAVQVTFTITEPDPSIGLATGTASFAATQGAAAPPAQTIAVSNVGGGSLTGLDAGVSYTPGQPGGWLAASVSPGTAPATLTLQATTTALPPGSYSATVAVSSAVADNSPRTVTVTYDVAEPPAVIDLDPSAVSFIALEGGPDPAQKSVSVTNVGGGALSGLAASVEYAAGQPDGWLTVQVAPTTAPATVTLQPITGNLPAGTYTATVRIASPVATNSPQAIAVSFTVEPPLPGDPGTGGT